MNEKVGIGGQGDLHFIATVIIGIYCIEEENTCKLKKIVCILKRLN